ncbi:MAG: hypothetical protein QM270_04320 [Bacillota bacterium]|nr:hypothetical protein [Bacillota bacterium]
MNAKFTARPTTRPVCRLTALLLAALLLLGATACSSTTATTTAPPAADSYVFAYEGIQIPLAARADEVLARLPEPASVFKAPSCLFEGEDEVYAFPGIEVYVGSYRGERVVAAVFLTDETAKTPEGLAIGDAAAEVDRIYGTERRESVGAFTYTKGDTELAIVTVQDRVTSIAYYGVFER